MSLSDVLDGSIKLLRANAKTIATVVLAFAVPLNLLSAVIQRDAGGGGGFIPLVNIPVTTANTSDGTTSAWTVVAALVVSLIQLLTVPLVAGALAKLVARSYLGGAMGAGEALVAALRRFPALLAAWFLVHLMELPGIVACGIGWVFIFPLFVAVSPAIVVEDLGPLAGIARSYRLVTRRYFPVMGTGLLCGLIASVVGSVLATPFSLVASLVGLRWGFSLTAVGGVLSTLVTVPIVTITATLIYFDLRIRTEGFDLQVIASELGERAVGPA